MKSSPHSLQPEKSLLSNEDPAKTNKFIKLKRWNISFECYRILVDATTGPEVGQGVGMRFGDLDFARAKSPRSLVKL